MVDDADASRQEGSRRLHVTGERWDEVPSLRLQRCFTCKMNAGLDLVLSL